MEQQPLENEHCPILWPIKGSLEMSLRCVRVFAGCGAFNKPVCAPPGKTQTTHQTNPLPPFHLMTSAAKRCESRVHFTIKGGRVCWTAATHACRCHGAGIHPRVRQRRHLHVTPRILSPPLTTCRGL